MTAEIKNGFQRDCGLASGANINVCSIRNYSDLCSEWLGLGFCGCPGK